MALMKSDEGSWEENRLPTRGDTIYTVGLLGMAVAFFLVNLYLTSILIATVGAGIVLAILVVARYKARSRPAMVAITEEGLRLVDSEGRERRVSWQAIERCEPASRSPGSHFVCVFRTGQGVNAVPLDKAIGAKIGDRLEDIQDRRSSSR